jgi:predicted restriction endonuclease
LLFTRIVEHRNQYLAITRVNKRVKPYSALDTLKFIEKSYVQTNKNSIHIAWTAILLHTRELLQPLYQWQASFDPLTRKYEQSKTKGLNKGEFRKLKVLIAKQITDDERVILAGLDPTFTIENIDKG